MTATADSIAVALDYLEENGFADEAAALRTPQTPAQPATESPEAVVRRLVAETVADVISDFADEPDTDRETVIERLDEECDSLFGRLVRHGLVSDYDINDMVSTAADCAAIISVAEADAWVEDDSGLWEGVTYGVLACVAFYSLRNLLYQGLSDAGHDTNDDYPFAAEETDEEEETDGDEE